MTGAGTLTGNVLNDSARLGELADNGGPTRTHALLPGSPAINKGAGCPARDQRGKQRQGKCDIVAFER